jgi:hypothetical protein
MKSSSHFFVVEDPSGVFHVERNATHGVAHGRFSTGEDAHAHAVQLKRDYLSPMTWSDGTPLTVPERVHLGVWRNDTYNELRERSRMRAGGIVQPEPRPSACDAPQSL